jgi:hypothetical protein
MILGGASLALGILSRSAVLVAVPILIAGSLLVPYPSRRARMGLLIPFSLSVLLILTPWWVRNYVAFGRPVFTSTLTGYNLFRHNHLLPTSDYLHYVAGAQGEEAVADLVARRSDLHGSENEAEMDKVYSAEAMRIIRAWPFRYAQLSAYRFLPLWFGWSVKEQYQVPIRVDDYLIMGEQGILLLLLAWGFLRLRLASWPLMAVLAGMTLAQVAVVGQLRYIVPAMPLALAIGAAGPLPPIRDPKCHTDDNALS